MKFIGPVNGTVALHVLGDDVTPPRGIVTRDLINFITTNYQFTVFPQIPQGIPPALIPSFNFQSGFMTVGTEKIPIVQLSVVKNGDLVTAVTTETADIVLNDLMARLNEQFGYRFRTAEMHRTYLSNFIVQFDGGLEKIIDALGRIETILSEHIPRQSMPFKIKRLAFGYGDPVPLSSPMSLDAVDNADFTIERRNGSPYSENRFFCSAPVRTAEHLALLERIEKEFGG